MCAAAHSPLPAHHSSTLLLAVRKVESKNRACEKNAIPWLAGGRDGAVSVYDLREWSHWSARRQRMLLPPVMTLEVSSPRGQATAVALGLPHATHIAPTGICDMSGRALACQYILPAGRAGNLERAMPRKCRVGPVQPQCDNPLLWPSAMVCAAASGPNYAQGAHPLLFTAGQTC